MHRYHHSSFVSIMSATALFAAGCARLCYGQGNLDERLAAIEMQASKGAQLGKLETEALKLIQDFRSPADTGKVYAHIAFLCARPGANKQPTKVIAYATMALKYPLELRDSVRIYLDLGSAITSKYLTIGPSECLSHRREIVVPFLSGLKLLLDNGVPEEPVPSPGVMKFDVPPDAPEYQQIVREHAQQMEARKRADALNELVHLRFVLTNEICGLYSQGTDAMAELQELSSQILKNDAVVIALLAKTKAERAKHIK